MRGTSAASGKEVESRDAGMAEKDRQTQEQKEELELQARQLREQEAQLKAKEEAMAKLKNSITQALPGFDTNELTVEQRGARSTSCWRRSCSSPRASMTWGKKRERHEQEYYKKRLIDLRASMAKEKEAKKRDNERFAKLVKGARLHLDKGVVPAGRRLTPRRATTAT